MEIKLYPKAGLQVAIPGKGYLSSQGEKVELDSYWRRRIKEGDVTEGKPKKQNT